MPVRRGPNGKFLPADAPDPEVQSEAVEEESYTIRTLRQTITKLSRDIEKAHTKEDLILDAVREVYEVPPNFYIPPRPKKSRKAHKEVAALHVADIHIGKVTTTDRDWETLD